MGPPRKIGFSIEADPEFIPANAFDQHIIIGGRFFDVTDGQYEILDEEGGRVLKLSSRHRISSWSNHYTSLWSRAIMHSIQQSILTVLAARISGSNSVPKVEEGEDHREELAFAGTDVLGKD